MIIYRQSFFHLIDHKNLFVEYPTEYFDIFLYHPTFCILFIPFSLMPVFASLILWTLLGGLIIFYAIKFLPIKPGEKVFFWWFVLIELATTLHSQQTNSIIAALGLFTFAFLERGKPKWAALFPVIAFCIKGYGLIFAALFLFYPKPGKYISYSILWLIIFAFLPLPFTGPAYFIQVYKDWLTCLTSDHAVNFGYSLMGLFQLCKTSFTESDLTTTQFIGLFLFAVTLLINLLNKAYVQKSQRMLLLAYCALWVIVFNHSSEPPTFIISAVGIAVFCLVNRKRFTYWPDIIAVIVLFFSVVAHKDIYSASWPFGFVPSLVAKTLPCVLVWLILQVQLFFKTETLDTKYADG
ncbi:DUF2029 domain-containing protein [Dyadobacter sp. UP-52]|uniref:DUF2029 domain-containing protein n=1 Tax=Dyadobacter subterraneus TaxID=2773304 RepID=A0ABR9W9Y8_9BACT|nr:DUF2029 domain-containing protein [Dyadobacter subterraneus]